MSIQNLKLFSPNLTEAWPKGWAVFNLAKEVWKAGAGTADAGSDVDEVMAAKRDKDAAPDSWFSHLAVEVPGENGSNEWLEAVSDETYSCLK